MFPTRGFDPSRITHPAGHPPTSDAHTPAPTRSSDTRASQSHPHDVPSQISPRGRPPIRVGSFKLPKGIGKHRLATWLKPTGEMTELDADDAGGSSGEGGRHYSYRAQDFSDESDKPDRDIEVRIHVDSSGQLKQLHALSPPGSDLEDKHPGFVEVDFQPSQPSHHPLGGVEQKLRKSAAPKPTAAEKNVKKAEEKLAEHIEAVKQKVEEQNSRNKEKVELLDQIRF